MNCSRCSRTLEHWDERAEFTIGYYDVRPSAFWWRFANTGEKFICDCCMWRDPRYIAVYGVMTCSCEKCNSPKKWLGSVRAALWARIQDASSHLSGPEASRLLQAASDNVWEAGIDELYDSLVGKVPTGELSGCFDLMWMSVYLARLVATKNCCCGGGCGICLRG